jgi:uncharacterized protein with HEPN domain
MSRPPIDRLQDIISSAALAQRYAADLDRASFAQADERRDAALFRLAVVCEAASRLPPDIQALAPEILWSDIRGMRNYIVHSYSYWQIDFAIVVDVLRNDLGPLGTAAERLIAIVQSDDP